MNDDKNRASNIIPFGKHRGLTVAEIARIDAQYLDWLAQQPWFVENFPAAYEEIRGFLPDANTPQHNLLQARFLERRLIHKIVRRVFGRQAYQDWREYHRRADITFDDWMVTHGQDWLAKWTVEFEKISDVVLTGPNFWRIGLELKPSIGDDYPAVLRQALRQQLLLERQPVLVIYERCNASVDEPTIGRIFAASNIGFLPLWQVEQLPGV